MFVLNPTYLPLFSVNYLVSVSMFVANIVFIMLRKLSLLYIIQCPYQDGESGWSSLHRALHFGHLAVASVLIDSGASFTLEDIKLRTPVDLVSGPVAQVIGEQQSSGN